MSMSGSASTSAAVTPAAPAQSLGVRKGGASSASSSASSSSRKQRVLWDSDSATRGGKTSIGVLLDWLASPGNYARWRDGKSQSGETREMLCSEIKAAMQRHGIRHRENANIRTQISELERSYEAARAWLAQGGYDPHSFERSPGSTAPSTNEAGRGPVEAHVLRLCRYYHVLHAVMAQAIHVGSTGDGKSLRLRRAYNRKKRERARTEQPEDGTSASEAGSSVDRERGRPAVSTPSLSASSLPFGPTRVVQPPSKMASSTNADGNATAASTAAAATAALPVAGLLGASTATLANLESTQRVLGEAAREDRERKRFCMEQQRHQIECDKLRLQVEAAKLQLTLDRALARKKLLDAGLPPSQVDALVPR